MQAVISIVFLVFWEWLQRIRLWYSSLIRFRPRKVVPGHCCSDLKRNKTKQKKQLVLKPCVQYKLVSTTASRGTLSATYGQDFYKCLNSHLTLLCTCEFLSLSVNVTH